MGRSSCSTAAHTLRRTFGRLDHNVQNAWACLRMCNLLATSCSPGGQPLLSVHPDEMGAFGNATQQ